MFVIVTTVKDGKTEVSCVPSSWVVNQELFWPPSTVKAKKINKMRINQVSPGADWISMPCKLCDCDPLDNYQDGMTQEKLFSSFADTDAEISLVSF